MCHYLSQGYALQREMNRANDQPFYNSLSTVVCKKCNKRVSREGSARIKNKYGRIIYLYEECKS